MKLSHRILLLSLILGLAPTSSWAQSESVYAPYALFPQGSSRAMAMGGAYTALSRDSSGIIYNPAGPALGRWTFDVGGTINRTTNREVNLNGSDSDQSVASDFLFTAVSYQFKYFVLGVGQSSPYQLALEEGFQTGSLAIESTDVLLATQLSRSVAVGVSYHYETFSVGYEESTGDSYTNSVSKGYARVGVAVQGRGGGVGITYTPARSFDLEAQNTSNFSWETWQKDAVLPEKITIGIFKKVGSKTALALDFDQISAVENAVHPSSGNGSTVDVFSKAQTVLHGGFEWYVEESKGSDVTLRIGGYMEPGRLEGSDSRFHTTFGLEVRLGPVIIAVSLDKADHFQNTAQGFSLALGEI